MERFWSLFLEGKLAGTLESGCAWDDPIHDVAPAARGIARFREWVGGHVESVHHLRTTAGGSRVVVEDVLRWRGGLIWNQEKQRGEKADLIEVATAVVFQKHGSAIEAIRVYFGTWSVFDGQSRLRAGPIAPDERAATKAAMDANPIVRKYFDSLALGDSTMIDLFEPDGYFREPANNFMCGRDQLAPHFQHILELGGVGIEFLTATQQDNRLGLELQTITWGKKTMEKPQAGFAIYELGPNGKLSAARVYDSTVPP